MKAKRARHPDKRLDVTFLNIREKMWKTQRHPPVRSAVPPIIVGTKGVAGRGLKMCYLVAPSDNTIYYAASNRYHLMKCENSFTLSRHDVLAVAVFCHNTCP